MKIKLDIDCTPNEVREFFGLPEVKPLQEEVLKELQERLRANIKAMDPETMLKTWLPATLKGRPLGAGEVFAAYDADAPLNGGWDTDARVCIEVKSPYPCTLQALAIHMATNEPAGGQARDG